MTDSAQTPRTLVDCTSVFDVTVYRRTHRLHAHGIAVDDDATFVDCAQCGAIDSRLERMRRLQDAPVATEHLQ